MPNPLPPHYVLGPAIGEPQAAAHVPQSFALSKLYVPLPINVNFVAESLPSVARRHPDHAALKVSVCWVCRWGVCWQAYIQAYAAVQVMSTLLSAKFLHREIREKNGAYGYVYPFGPTHEQGERTPHLACAGLG